MNDCQYVVSNIHGYIRSFNALLADWNIEEETLVVTGNVINYGHNSFLVCQKLLELANFYPDKVVFLKGKHEALFESFYKNPSSSYSSYIEEGGLATLLSFYDGSISYEELNDRYYMLDAIVPETDFTELFEYLISTQERYETPSSVFLSHSDSLLDTILPNQIMDTRTLFLNSDEDPRFKLHYLNHYLPERLVREGKLDVGDLILFQNRYVLLGKDPSGWTEAYSWGHHIKNGIVTEMSQIPAED